MPESDRHEEARPMAPGFFFATTRGPAAEVVVPEIEPQRRPLVRYSGRAFARSWDS